MCVKRKPKKTNSVSVENEQRSGWPNEVDDDQIKAIIESDRHVTRSKITMVQA